MPNDRNTQKIAALLQEWITLEEAAELHPTLTAEKLCQWQKIGLLQSRESGTRIWLPSKVIGKARCVRARDIVDFIDARKPDAPKELVERFAQ